MTNPETPSPKDNMTPRPTFPILKGDGARIDYQLVVDHGEQARKNHYQSVERLAQRGGLSWCELHAVLHGRAYQKMDHSTAIIECRALEARYLAAIDNLLPQNVINLVIAAREFWDGNNDLSDESRALDKALEPFAKRVPYENEPDAATTEGSDAG